MINITQNDFGIDIIVSLVDDKKVAVNLTGSTVSATVVFPDKSKKTYSMGITDAINGKAKLSIIAEMTATKGTYMGYITVTNGATKVTAEKTVSYYVAPLNGGA